MKMVSLQAISLSGSLNESNIFLDIFAEENWGTPNLIYTVLLGNDTLQCYNCQDQQFYNRSYPPSIYFIRISSMLTGSRLLPTRHSREELGSTIYSTTRWKRRGLGSMVAAI